MSVLSELPQDERKHWEDVFEKFATAWNLGWKFVDRFACQEIPQVFRSIKMTPDTPICFCLPDERDEG